MADPRQENRSFPIPTRFSGTERDQLTRAAEAAGVSRSDFIRAATLSQPLPPARPRRASRPTVEDGDKLALALSAVGRIGNNVNQLAHIANAGRWPELAELQQAVSDIRWMRNTLMQSLGVQDTAPTMERKGP